MRKKSVGIFMLVIIIGVAGYVLFPHISNMGESSKKRNLIRSAKVYGDEVKNLWNSDAIYCDPGTGMKSLIAVPDGDYYVVLGKNANNTGLPVIKLDKVDDKYYGYVHVVLKQRIPSFSVFLTDGNYVIKTDKNYSALSISDVEEGKMDFTFDSNYHYCQGDQN